MKKKIKLRNKPHHNEIIDYIKNTGSLLGYNTDVKDNIKTQENSRFYMEI